MACRPKPSAGGVKLLIDEMWSHVVAEQLRQRGYDVESVLESLLLKSKSDRIVFDYCLAEGRVMVTENMRDFRRLASVENREGREHPGVILTNPDAFPRGSTRGIGLLVQALQQLLESNVDLTNIEWWLTPPDR
jgi:predicted nuclease of predicted toxin-antitoxin system